MPLPLVHLAIAMHLHEGGERPDPLYLLGSIAPDAIHMRPDTTSDDKRRVHLVRDTDEERVDAIHDLSRCYGRRSDALAPLVRGYVAHLLGDLVWVRSVYADFSARVPAECDRAERRRLYYLDTDQIDFDLYHEMPWRPWVWQQLSTADPVDLPGFLTADEMGRWRDRTLHWYHETKEEPGIVPRYITRSDVDAFVIAAAERIAAYDDLWRQE